MIIPLKTEIIENFRKENNLSKTQFCKLCKIQIDTYNRIMSKEKNYRLSALFKIARVIKIQVYQLFD